MIAGVRDGEAVEALHLEENEQDMGQPLTLCLGLPVVDCHKFAVNE